MATSAIELPHYQDIDTPWEPQPIIWAEAIADMSYDAYREQASRPRTHLVRQVRSSASTRSVPEILAHLDRADEHFAYLQDATSVQVLPREWFVYTDPTQKNRILAKVPIVEGKTVTSEDGDIRVEAQDATDIYRSLRHPSGLWLADIDPRQMMYGYLRGALAAPALWLVDIEPVLLKY